MWHPSLGWARPPRRAEASGDPQRRAQGAMLIMRRSRWRAGGRRPPPAPEPSPRRRPAGARLHRVALRALLSTQARTMTPHTPIGAPPAGRAGRPPPGDHPRSPPPPWLTGAAERTTTTRVAGRARTAGARRGRRAARCMMKRRGKGRGRGRSAAWPWPSTAGTMKGPRPPSWEACGGCTAAAPPQVLAPTPTTAPRSLPSPPLNPDRCRRSRARRPAPPRAACAAPLCR